MKPELISFDTNAWTNLVRRATPLHQQALILLRSTVRQGHLQVVLSAPLVRETAALASVDKKLWRDSGRELSRLCRCRLLRYNHERITQELKLQRALKRREMFHPTHAPAYLFKALAGDELISRAEAIDLEEIKKEWQQNEVDAREGVRRESDPLEKKGWNAAFRSDPKSKVIEWCRMDSDAANIERPDQLPSLWHRVSYKVARIYLVGTEGEGRSRVDGNDLVDWEHYIDACYSTALVTDDERLHRIGRLCPEPKVKLVKLDEWAVSILSKR